MQFSLCSFKTEDASALVKHARNFNISKNLKNQFQFPYTHKDSELLINFSLSQEPFLVKEIDGEVMGSINIHP